MIFAKAGVAAIGCNIHDNMLAYVFVADAPWGPSRQMRRGTARLADIPPGTYHALRSGIHAASVPDAMVAMDVIVDRIGRDDRARCR